MHESTRYISIGRTQIALPAQYAILTSLANDPRDSVPFAFSTNEASCLLTIYPVSAKDAMPFSDPDMVVDSLHESMDDEQGIIEVEGGVSGKGNEYIFRVVKTSQGRHGMRYDLTRDLRIGARVIRIQGSFEEKYDARRRYNDVYEVAYREGRIRHEGWDTIGWSQDPYTPGFQRGILRNLSEDRKYDAMYPRHPLSVLHSLMNKILAKN